MNENICVFTEYEGRYVLLNIVDGRTEHIYAYTDLYGPGPGSVINCVADSGAEGIGSSFVMYGPKMLGFINKKLKGGMVYPLMYKSEPGHDLSGSKKPKFTDIISIDGEYVIASSQKPYVKCSKKIPLNEKEKLAELFSEKAVQYGMGILVRTKTYLEPDGIKKAEEEIDAIKDIFGSIRERSGHAGKYTVLYSPLPEFVKDIMYLCDKGATEVITDDENIISAMNREYVGITAPVSLTDRVGLRKYRDELVSLGCLYSLKRRISEVLSRTVHLKSGAYISINVTEALTAIDVNSSQNSHKTGREETFYAVNAEAAAEAVRQLRLRNISGIVIIDFIDMKSEDDYAHLAELLKEECKNDRYGCSFIDFTGLKLAELVRRRHGLPLYNALAGRPHDKTPGYMPESD
ncbi:MAG: ribonuclease E/G [Lachnospiraceae bacterium]|nr:ribonuclease E/G [Lachnospiraceae bacterium]